MSDFQNEMNHAVQGFVAQIAELARRAALDTLESAFGSRGGGGRNGGGRGAGAAGGGRAAVAAIAAGAGRAGRPRGGRGAKRSAADLEMLSEKFATFVKTNPGL